MQDSAYDSLADREGRMIRGLRRPGGILLHSPELSRYARPLNRYLRHEARVRRARSRTGHSHYRP